MQVTLDKIASVTSRLKLPTQIETTGDVPAERGTVVVVEAMEEKEVYGELELVGGRLARIIKGDLIAGVLGERQALKGFVGSIPESHPPGRHPSCSQHGWGHRPVLLGELRLRPAPPRSRGGRRGGRFVHRPRRLWSEREYREHRRQRYRLAEQPSLQRPGDSGIRHVHERREDHSGLRDHQGAAQAEGTR